jgi:glutamate-ammonia-ligase adenylyltransferase
MDVAQLRRYLDEPSEADAWLRSMGLVDVKKAHANLAGMAARGITLDLLAVIFDQLGRHLGCCADPDMALNNLARFSAEARNPLALGTLFERDPEALPTLVQIFSTSQHLSDSLVTDPESFDRLRMTGGEPFARQRLVEDLISEVEILKHDRAVLKALRRFKRRETLRIAFGDVVRQQSLETVTTQISYLADAVLEAALQIAWRRVARRRGSPRRADGQPARFVVLGLGKLGGVELNYSSDVDLIFLYDEDGRTDDRRPITNAEFFEHLGREFVRLLVERTEMGTTYRVDLRLRPEGQRGPMVVSVPAAVQYYENRGRTWERQAFIKARPVAGDLQLGVELLERLSAWIYRRYLSRADITGIRALKRRIEQGTRREGGNLRNVKTGRGGIRDVEFVIQFLQLLNGGDLPKLRTPNTLEAIARLQDVGCLTNLEGTLLAENYSFLRKVEHRLQIMFDLQTHLLPEDEDELRKLALRMGYADQPGRTALSAFEEDYREKTEVNRRILDHLLHDAFGDDAQTEAEVDLVLDPDPSQERIAEVLGKYPFRDVKQAYRNLTALAEEKIRFLSTRRCRHFLASIAPGLLEAIASTADPDSTLVNLDKVSDSVGGKGVLWELFSFNPPSLKLYVRLCAYAPYLCGILTSNPGMLDGLMDSLVLNKLPTKKSLQNTLADLCRGAEDLDPILHSFKNDQQLRVGVRDLLSKEDVRATTRVLSEIAETCLQEIASREYRRLARKFGEPTIESPAGKQRPCEMAVLAMGKFGGGEMNYRSDLDIVFLYEADGQTVRPAAFAAGDTTTNQHFFSELGQRIIKTTGRLSAYGRLYEVDARLRPTGRSGVLATSLEEFARYFAEGHGQLWERQALCKARVVVGSPRFSTRTMGAVNRAGFDHEFRPADADEIRRMRRRLEETAGGGNLKRGPGGIVDVEFVVQMLQLKYGRRTTEVRTPNTLAALETLHEAGYLSIEDFEFFTESYCFLRSLESRLCLTNFSSSSDQLPRDPTELGRLSHLLRWPSRGALLVDFERYLAETRRRFDRIFDVAGS